MKFIYAALLALAFSGCATQQTNSLIAKPTEKQYSGRAILVGPNVTQEAVQSELLLWVGLQDSAPNLTTQDLKRCIVADESLKTATAAVPQPALEGAPATTPFAATPAPPSECSSTPQKCVFIIDEKRASVFSRSEPRRAQICIEKVVDSDLVLVDLYWPTQPVYWTTYAFQDLKANFDKKFGPDKVKFAQITPAQ